jgi:predicted metal-binding membrane protein
MRLLALRDRTAILLLGAALAAWVVTVQRMWGMDEGPGTDLGGLAWYLGIWVTMTAAMMLPSVMSAATVVARVSGGLPTLVFIIGYLAAWTAYGIVAYGLFRLVSSFETDWLAWDRSGPYVAGGVIAAAGLYELTPFKARLLHRCRRPPEQHGALRNGLVNGLDCVGCCFGLVAVLFVLGVMSVFWMAIVAAVIFAEKVLPHGLGISRAVAIGMVVLGLSVAASPSSIPGLTDPDHASPMRMSP